MGKLPPIEEIYAAFNIAQRNAYCKRHTDEEVLYDVFIQGYLYGSTGEPPKDRLDEIVNNK